ncbi:MAG: hypothetical protein GY898_29100 [Proteobacteria bacterium]|nr:hypothetical protein [Pseudomonadota bacterium]
MDAWTLARRLAVGALVIAAVVLTGMVGRHLGPLGSDGFVRESICLALAGVVLVGWSGATRTEGWRVLLVVILAVLSAELLIIQANGRVGHWGDDRQVAEWGTFHYYLGGKYFPELHYTDLYKQAVIADWDGGEGPHRFNEVVRVRDLHTYKFVPVKEVRDQAPLESFSEARWAEFKRDIRWFGRQAKGKRWRKILGDRGYNPPPSYVLVSGTLCNLLAIDKPASQTLLIGLDMLLLLGALLLSIRAYGPTRSLLVLAVFLAFYGNVNRVYGQIWILDWFAAAWAAAAAWKLDKHGLSGALIAYAACMRVFPGVLIIGPVVALAPRMLRERAIPPHLLRFAGAAALTAGLLVVGSTARYGTGAWQDWVSNITEHNSEHEGGARRFGLKQVFTLDWQAGLARKDRKVRTSRLEENAGLYKATRALFLLLAIAAMLRSDEHDAMLIGAAIFFAGIIASRYYGALLVLLLLLGMGRSPPETDRSGSRPLSLRALDFGMIFLIWAVYAAPFGGEPRHQYVFSNMLWAAWWMALFSIRLGGYRPMGRDA